MGTEKTIFILIQPDTEIIEGTIQRWIVEYWGTLKKTAYNTRLGVHVNFSRFGYRSVVEERGYDGLKPFTSPTYFLLGCPHKGSNIAIRGQFTLDADLIDKPN